MQLKQVATVIILSIFQFIYPALVTNYTCAAENNVRYIMVLHISERNYQDVAAIGITFSGSLDSSIDYGQFLTVSKESGDRVDGSWVLAANKRELFFPYLEPNTDYVVTVYENLVAASGFSLDRGYTKSLHTRNLKPVVAFASSGHILPAGVSHGLPLITVNIKAVDIDFYRVKPDRMASFLQTWDRSNPSYRYYLKRIRAFTDLAYSARFDLKPEKNKRTKVNLPLQNISALQASGIYMLVMREAGNHEEYKTSYFMVSDLALHARVYEQQIQVHISTLHTGKPVKAANVSLLDKQGKVLQETATTKDGIVDFVKPKDQAHYLLAKNKQHMAIVKLTGPALDLSEFAVGERQYRRNEVFLYGPRDLYRPGEEVIVNALVRNDDGRFIKAVALKSQIFRADGRLFREFVWQPKMLGYYHYSLPLPDNAATGKWRLETRTPDGKTHRYIFNVEEFLPERMKLTLNHVGKQQRFVKVDETLQLEIQGDYLYGAPAGGNDLDVMVVTTPLREAISSLADFQFGQVDEKGLQNNFQLDRRQLNERGKDVLSIDSRWKNTQSPVNIQVIASLFESGGRAISRSIQYTSWPEVSLIGMRALYPDGKRFPSNSQAEFEIVNANQQGALLPAENLKVNLIREYRDYYWEYNTSRGWYWQWVDQPYGVFTKDLSITAGQRQKLILPVEWGTYRLEITNPDTQLKSSYRFQVGYSWGRKNQQLNARPDQVVMSLDKAAYKAGEVATLQMMPPYSGQALILLESSEGVLWQQRISMPAKGTSVAIPVQKQWQRHDIYASVTVFRKADGKKFIGPNRAMGLVHLPLDRTERQLKLVMDLPEKILPNQNISTTLTVMPVAGIEKKSVDLSAMDKSLRKWSADNPVYITLAAVDIGVLNIIDFQTPDPFDWFFKQRRYGVESFDVFDRIIMPEQGVIVQQRFGGDADLSRGGKKPQSDVRIISLFHQAVAVDENGQAQIELQIPDFNGKLRFMALAFGEYAYGMAEKELTVAARLIAETSLPRFLAAGDESFMALDLHNISGRDHELSVRLKSSRQLGLGKKRYQLSLKDQQKNTIRIPIKAKSISGMAQIDVHITSSGKDETVDEAINVRRDWRLGIRPAYPAITKTKRAIVKSGKSFKLPSSFFKNIVKDSIQARFLVSSSPPIDLQAHLSNLLQYPYGCLEQTTSRAFPLLYVTGEKTVSRENNQKPGITSLPEETRLRRVADAIDHILSMQKYNGSFALWDDKGPEQYWLTAYVTDFLLQAKKLGFTIPETMLSKALKRLQSYVRSNASGSGFYSFYPMHTRFAYKAYSAYVLSTVNKVPLSPLRGLYDNHQQQVRSTLPLIHLGIALKNAGDEKRAKQAYSQALKLERDPYHYLSDYGSIVRDLALTVYLNQKHNLQLDKNHKLFFSMMDYLRGQRWLSTQDRFALFMAGSFIANNNADELVGELKTKEGLEKISQNGPLSRYFSSEKLSRRFRYISRNEEPVYVHMKLNAYSSHVPKSYSNKLNIERDYYSVDGQLLDFDEVSVGDLVLVHLSLEAEERVPDTLVVDMLPAGFELENQNLNHSIKLEQFKINNKKITDLMNGSKIKYQEFRDDRYVAAIDMDKNRADHLFYMLRAVTPGKYRVPPSLLEDMYRPYMRAVGHTIEEVTVTNKSRE